MSSDLRTALRKEADRLADEFYERAMSLLSAEVSGMFGKGKKEEVPSGPASQEETETALASVVEALKKAGGLRMEGLRVQTGIDKRVLEKAIRLGLESDQLTKTGQRRATTYRLPKPRR